MTITESNDTKMEKFLEEYLYKKECATTAEERNKAEIVIEAVYQAERKNALKECKDPKTSMGFNYFIENYRNHEKCLEFFAAKMVSEVLTEKEDVETKIHSEYSTYQKFSSDAPNEYLIDIISEYDEDLGKFVESNLTAGSDLNAITSFSESISSNWHKYDTDKAFFTNLIDVLNEYFNENCKNSPFTSEELIAYIFSAHNILSRCKQINKTAEELEQIKDKIFETKHTKWLRNLTDMNIIVANAKGRGLTVGNMKYILTLENA